MKASSKFKVCRLLKTKGNVYLPPEKETKYRLLSDIIKGNVKVSSLASHCFIKLFKKQHVDLINVPRFEGLNIKKNLAFTRDNSDIDDYYTLYKPEKYPSNEHLCNLSKCTQKDTIVWLAI